MVEDKNSKKITIDDVITTSMIFLTTQKHSSGFFNLWMLSQLTNELAVSDTARIGYTNALKAELEKIEIGE